MVRSIGDDLALGKNVFGRPVKLDEQGQVPRPLSLRPHPEEARSAVSTCPP